MGLFDNISSGLGSLASEVGRRNDSVDLAILQNNQDQRQKTSQYYMTNIGQEQMRADKTILQHQTKMQEDSSYIPENFSSREEFNQFLREHADSKEITGRTNLKNMHRLYGDEKFWQSMNAMGLTSAILGKGKWIDSESTKLQTIIDEDGNETLGFQPKVRTADAGRKQIYSADMTKGGANVRDIYAEGGDDALADSRIAISLDDLDKVFDRYYTDTYIAGEGAPNAEMLAQTLPFFPETSEERANLEQQLQETVLAKDAADYNVTAAEATLDTQQRGVDRAAAATEALGGQPTGQQAAITAATDDTKGEVPAVGGQGVLNRQGDSLAQNSDELKAQLPHNGGGRSYLANFNRDMSYVGHVIDKSTHPFNMTDDQWNNMLNKNEREMYKKLEQQIDNQTHAGSMRKAGSAIGQRAASWERAIERRINKTAMSTAEGDQVKEFYKKHNPEVSANSAFGSASDRMTDDYKNVFKANPELKAEFEADPIKFAQDHADKFGNKASFKDIKAINGNMNGASASKVITAVGIPEGTGDIDMAALNEQANKLGEVSDKQQEELVALQNKEKNNFLQYSEKARANLALKYYASLKQDSEQHANAFANGALGLFIETGSWDLAGEKFQLDYQKYDLMRQKHNVDVQGILNKAGQITDPSPIFTTSYNAILKQFEGSGGEEATMLTPAGLNEFNFAMKPALISARNIVAGSTTPGAVKGALNEIDVLSELTMQVLGDYINTIPNSKWDTFVSLGFASSNGARAFDSVSNVVPVDQYDQPTTDLSKVRGYIRMNADGTLVGVTGTSHKLSNTTLRKDIGQDGLEMLFTIGISNYARIIGEKEGAP